MSEWGTWTSSVGKVDKYGNQVFEGVCKKENKPTYTSESYSTPTCGHEECKPDYIPSRKIFGLE